MSELVYRDRVKPAADGGALLGKTVAIIGGTSGIGLATAKLAYAAGASVALAGRKPSRLIDAVEEVDAEAFAVLDAFDASAVRRFFTDLDAFDHVFVTAGAPYYAVLPDIDAADAATAFATHVIMMLEVAKSAPRHLNAGGSLTFMTGTGARRPGVGLAVAAAVSASMAAAIPNLALEIAPARINAIAAGFVDTPLSAALLGDGLQARRDELTAHLPIRRVVTAEDVGSLAVHLMINEAITGATLDIDGGQQAI